MKKALFAGLFLLPVAAQADPRDDALTALLHCSRTGDKAQRLACYDSAVVRIPGALRAPMAPPIAAAPTPPPIAAAPLPPVASVLPAPDIPPPMRHTKRSNGFLDKLFGPDGPKRAPQHTVAEFGSESVANGGTHAYPQAMDEDTIDGFSARLTNYDLGSGALIVTLDNGQVWRQVSGDPVGRLQYGPSGYVATISRGGSGAYAMKLSHLGRTLPVRRIR